MECHQGIGFEKACRLSNTIHSEIAPSLSLPSLPVSTGAADPALGLFEDAPGRGFGDDWSDVLPQVEKIVRLLRDCDVGYLNLNKGAKNSRCSTMEVSNLYNEVLKQYPAAFDCSAAGPFQSEHHQHGAFEKKPFIKNISTTGDGHLVNGATFNNHVDNKLVHEPLTSADSSKPKVMKKENDSKLLSSGPAPPDLEAILGAFCEMLEDFCGKAEVPDEIGGIGGPSIPLVDIKILINEITSASTKKILHLVPLDTLVRVINVLDHQIQCGQGLSINENENSSAEVLPMVLHALESTHAILVIMTQQDMPKQLYKEEVIERIVDFSRYQIMEVLAAYNPIYHNSYEPNENGEFYYDEGEDDVDNGPVAKKRRNTRTANAKKSTVNKVSTAVYTVAQKLCSILDYIKDLLSTVRLADSCIFQLLKASVCTFLVDNIHLLQLKSINLLCG